MRRVSVLLFCLAAAVHAQPALTNGGFEESLASGPAGWSFEHWQKEGGATGRLDAAAHDGRQSVLIEARADDDARFVQTVAVLPSSWYRVSAWIKTENVDPAKTGAHLSVMGAMAAAGDVRGTTDWARVAIAVHTGPDQHELPLALRLGFYGATTTGRAWFDDVRIEPAAGADGLPVLNLAPAAPRPNPSALLETLLTALLYLAVLWLARPAPPLANRKGVAGAIALAAAVLAAKAVLAAFSPGYPADVGTFSAWASDVFRLGPSGFYRDGYFADYPPGFLYVLWLVGAAGAVFHLDPGSPVFLLILKLPALLADVGGAWVLAVMGGKPWKLLVPLVWLLSPLAATDSALWGQVDAVFSLALLAAFWLLETRRLTPAAVLLAVAVLLKPQALVAAPLAVLWLLSERPSWKSIRLPLAAFVVTAAVLALPFAWNKPPLWLFGLYAQTLGSYDFASLNAANLWYLLGRNWAAASDVWGLPLNVWGSLAAGVAALALGWAVWKSRLSGRWLFGAFGLYVVLFAFGTKMHERYLFPAALLGLGAYQLLRDPRVLWAAVGAGLIGFADVLATLRSMQAGSAAVAAHDPLLLAASVAMLALAGFTLYLAFDLLVRGRVWQPRPRADLPLPSIPKPQAAGELPGSEGRARAFWAVAALTAGYAVLALWNLGSPSSPQRYWEPRNPGQSQTFDLGETKQLSAVQYHFGLGSGAYALDYSVDGKTWKTGLPLVNDNPYAEFRWRTVQDPETARYVRITLTRGHQQLNELALQDPAGAWVEPLPSGSALFDEPDTRVKVSDSSNGMYFDEVYFARSGWEIAQGRQATENTHPPLGKVILAGSISLLGMNPLAWRLPGTLFGIAMIPLMYLLALRLFGRRIWAFLAAFFLAVDFLHFTQTRIGTVDGYVMLFVLAAYYALLRWYQESRTGGAPAWWLLASGGAIALAIATKWIGIYAAGGLAALFVCGCIALGRDWFGRNGRKTLAVCVAAFVVIPVAVYIAAYIPQMQAAHTGLEGIVANQVSMWNYHTQLKDTHPYSSPWYEWPLMVKPIWYYSGASAVPAGTVSTIVALGNPLVWWGGTAAFVFVLVRVFRKPADAAAWFIALAGLAQYLPWAVIPRKLVFLYHFFMTVPFLVLALVYALREPSVRWRGRLPEAPAWAAAGFAGLLFAAYFPVLGATPIPSWWAETLKAVGIPIYF
jgi:Gpi18-like mannosyltransferase/4-amino-4-deoxy-L-arabinose transferase-like glycosyltransferase